ncbi:MAG: Gfo/Idh/MocA family oxidoreductase [Chitinophagaceae bacterium]|jgi:UDP-N-acetyl-2-amino-2-deoxyglucuronate dehydrogenase|nr:Gfo/Idh/MocA family oxidoreductase [Chitinophagaceae bacterium]
MKPLNFILVGCGTIGERHALLANQKGILMAVCDIDEQKVKRFSKQYSCYGYTSLDEMLQSETDADALLVCTPNGLHAAHSISGLKAAKHVLCEKPMALSTADCKKMIAAATKAKKHLLIVKQNRLNPPVAAVKQLLDKKKLGTIYSVQINCCWNRAARYYQQSDWRGTKALDGGVLFTQFSHFMDLLYWFFGDVKKVKGFTANLAHKKIIEVEDTGVFSFVTEAGVPGTLHYSTNAANKNFEGSVTILAEKATIKIGGPYLNKIEYQEPVLIDTAKLMESNSANKYKGYQGSMNNHASVYDEFIKVIAGKQKNYVSGEEGIHSVKMIEQFYKAAASERI